MSNSSKFSGSVGGSFLPSIFLSPDSVQVNTGKLMGRQSAGRGFMRGFARSFGGEGQVLRLVHGGGAQREVLEREARDTGWVGEIVHCVTSEPSQWAKGVLYYPAPMNSRMGWQRSRLGMSSVALCGVTHTISSSGVLEQLAEYVDGPFAGWDALICTSNSVLKAVHEVWEVRREYLARRLGVDSVSPELPLTPVIPLGVHVDDFAPDDALRALGRAEWGVDEDEVVVLFVGRLSIHAKANPLPMYLACARAAALTGRRVRVVECGWFSNEAIRAAFAEAAGVAGVQVTYVDGRVTGVTRKAFASADVFMSLSDNIQETFGLTPLEAMAAGLPVVVSDWDGYRETVRDGVDGFLIPSLQPADVMCAKAMSEAYEDGRMNYDHYIGHAHLMVGVDVQACAAALARLVKDPVLRRSMGEAGRIRAREVFDWSVVMEQYEALWLEQEARRVAAVGSVAGAACRDATFINPLRLFDHYPSKLLEEGSLLWRDALCGASDVVALRALSMWGFSGDRVVTPEAAAEALLRLPLVGEAGMSVADWAVACGWPVHKALRQAVWLHKVGGVVV